MAELEQMISKVANALLAGKSHIKLLEAGCGSASHIGFNAIVHAVGIDICKEQLEQNSAVQEKILGDIQDYPLPKNEYDVVICWMVLEHLVKPREALLNLCRAVKPHGLLILGFPNLYSIKGIVTKFTPFWFHALFYKFMKYTSRHFPTHLRIAILPKKVMQLAQDSGFNTEFYRLVEGDVSKRLRTRFRLIDLVFFTVELVVRIISMGRLQSPLLDGCAMILKKSEKCS
jgi:ubiquinone/menaquinone biosynthesis C-methylase UbiE